MINRLKTLLSKWIKPKLLVHFTTHGCQAQIKEFNFVGKIVSRQITDRTKYYPHEFYHIVNVIYSVSERYKKGDVIKVPAWYCIKVGSIIIFED